MENKILPGALTPELDISDMAASLAFYSILGFEISYERSDEGFAFLVAPRAEIMLQLADGPGRRFRTAPLETPFGRGVNFQLEVNDVDGVYLLACDAEHTIVVDIEDRWYRTGDEEQGNRQFVVADPDGYLWRPYASLGSRRI